MQEGQIFTSQTKAQRSRYLLIKRHILRNYGYASLSNYVVGCFGLAGGSPRNETMHGKTITTLINKIAGDGHSARWRNEAAELITFTTVRALKCSAQLAQGNFTFFRFQNFLIPRKA